MTNIFVVVSFPFLVCTEPEEEILQTAYLHVVQYLEVYLVSAWIRTLYLFFIVMFCFLNLHGVEVCTGTK